MSMGTIGKALKATRTQMIESESERIARDFTELFRMRDGDYIRYRKTGEHWKQARIMNVEKCYWNSKGGCTAWITVIPMLCQGKLGKTRSLVLCVNENGGDLHGVHFCNEVERLPAVKSND